MKIKDEIKQIQNKSINELTNELRKYQDKLRQVNFNVRFRKQKNIKEAKQLKSHVARIWTTINKKIEIEASKIAAKKGAHHE